MDSQQMPRQTDQKPPMAYPQVPPPSSQRLSSAHNGPASGPRLPSQHPDERGPVTPPGVQQVPQVRGAGPFGPPRGPGVPRNAFPSRPPAPRPGPPHLIQGGQRFPGPGAFQNNPPSGPPRQPYPGPRPPIGGDQHQSSPSLSRSSSLSQEDPKDTPAFVPSKGNAQGHPNAGGKPDPRIQHRLQRNDSSSSVNEQRVNTSERPPRILVDRSMADVREEGHPAQGKVEDNGKMENKVSEQSSAQKKEPENLKVESTNENRKKSAQGSTEDVDSKKKEDGVPSPARKVEDSPKEESEVSLGSNLSAPRSPGPESLESVKGFDNGQRRSLSSKTVSREPSPKTPSSPKSPEPAKTPEQEKKKTHFADDTVKDKGQTETKTPSTDRSDRNGSSKQDKENAEKQTLLAKSTKKTDAENDSGVDESTQRSEVPTTNGVAVSPTKKFTSKSREEDKRSTAASPVKSPSKSSKSLPRTPDSTSSNSLQEKKKLPMNKVQVGAAPSPNLKTVRSKIGSLENASYKPGGGKVKIENRKLDFSKAQPKIAAKNDNYTPSGGDKKITQVKLQWNAKPKVGSLENATYKPGGGDKKIETVKLDFKDKAKPKVGSKENAKHVPGGGNVKSPASPSKTPQDSNNDIETQKLDIKAESKVGSLNNVKHKPGGGDKKIFNDKDYLKQMGSNAETVNSSGTQVHRLASIAEEKKRSKTEPQPPPSTPTRVKTPAMNGLVNVTPQAVRTSLAGSPEKTPKKTPREDSKSRNIKSKGEETPRSRPVSSNLANRTSPTWRNSVQHN